MSNNGNPDRARRTALDAIDRQERQTTIWIVVAAVAEAIGLVLYLYLMDFSDRLHWLILIAAGLVYTTLTLMLGSVIAEVKSAGLRTLRAIEELRAEPGS